MDEHVYPSSFPTRERGLKFDMFTKKQEFLPVVPHAGTWIEMVSVPHRGNLHQVVPHAGTWIEISLACTAFYYAFMSFPTRERGLKSELFEKVSKFLCVVPHAGTWIEISQNPLRQS